MTEKFTVEEGWSVGTGASNVSANSSQLSVKASGTNVTINASTIHVQNSTANALINTTSVFIDNYKYALPFGMVYLDEGVIVNQAELDLLLWPYFDEGFKTFFILLNNVITRTNNQDIDIRLSTDYGSSYDAGVTDYQTAGVASDHSGTPVNLGTAGTSALDNMKAVGNTFGASGWVLIINPEDSSTYTNIVLQNYTANTTADYVFMFAGYREAAQASHAIRFLAASGNLQAGAWRLYGLHSNI